jgi:cytidylate kinase
MDIITIDGLSASGKSSVAREIARRLGVPYVSSGLLYRGVAYLGLHAGIPLDDENWLIELLSSYPLELLPLPEGNRLLARGEDITPHLHSAEIDLGSSRIARHPRIRAYVNDRLRQLPPPFVAEGRDMGSQVFPEAAYKFYLTAQPEVRAHRRAFQQRRDEQAVMKELLERDAVDAPQSAPAPEAIILDTSSLTLEEVVERILRAL